MSWCSKSKANCDTCHGHFHASSESLRQSFVEPEFAAATSGGRCCYSDASDCDSSRDWCSKNQSRCDTCNGTFYSAPSQSLGFNLVALHPQAAAASPRGRCCYSDASDCDSSRDWCSKNQSRCDTCNGTFYSGASRSPAFGVVATSPQLAVTTPCSRCCYSDASDCDSSHDWCSKSQSRCDDCNGTFYSSSAQSTRMEHVAFNLQLA